MRLADAQAALLNPRTPDCQIGQQSQTVNAVRVHLTAFGIVVAKDIHTVDQLGVAAAEGPEAVGPARDLRGKRPLDLCERIEAATKRSGHRKGRTHAAPHDPGPWPNRLQCLFLSRRRGFSIPARVFPGAWPYAKAHSSGKDGSPRRATRISGARSLHGPWYSAPAGGEDAPERIGRGVGWSESQRRSWPSHRPTEWPARLVPGPVCCKRPGREGLNRAKQGGRTPR